MSRAHATRLAMTLLIMTASACHQKVTVQKPARAAEDFIRQQSEGTSHSGREAGIITQYAWALDEVLSAPGSERASATKNAYQAAACMAQSVDFNYQRRLRPQVEQMLITDPDRRKAYIEYVKTTSSMPSQSPYLDACNGNQPRI